MITGADDNHLAPGDGRIDWEQFLRGLKQVRFRGALALCNGGSDGKAHRAVGTICAMSQGAWALTM
jgi:sugar phosphate isomerase/epimerase